MRPYLLFVSGITGIAGMAFAPGMISTVAIPIALAAFLSYGFGQALTDCFQIDTDSVSAPYRPLTKGVITQRQVLVVSAIGLTCCIAVFAIRNPINLGLGIAAGIGLATYTYFKRRWWGGPWYNAWIVSVLFTMGYIAGAGIPFRWPESTIYLALGAVFFGYANFVLSGYFKDIEADRKAAYNTLPVVFGRKVAAVGSDFFAAGMWVCLAAYFRSAFRSEPSAVPSALTMLFLLGAGGTTLVAQILLHRIQRDEDSHPAIGLVVHGYILSLSAVACTQYPSWGPILLLFYLLFVLTLRARPSRSQI
jgi:4-hydroxybenzoate polyprenyltransferase